ncbi:GNAT family N-acetyltransferase [Nocardiopsis sp. B62]|uniref:GNAT family N-acetyltransferase n=1 Tax=Nocardiopsis sp. B62 TaxID=2824874 RepID=UPI001B37914B|nr:GNAT family N-acetyltransferase [Nocardiopsis sp. B62]MBQ1083483.1 GNAT family N-acetyltransferase [Nocardiopsis sp. B62]
MPLHVAIEPDTGTLDTRACERLVRETGAPVFYSPAFLRAFEAFPLHSVERGAHILVHDGAGRAHAVLPVYLQRGVDPMGALAANRPGSLDHPVLLSHVWHCYETTIPALSPEAARMAVDAMGDLAGEWGASLYGAANVGADSDAARLLGAAGLSGTPLDRMWSMDVSGLDGFDAYLESLGGKPRREMRRQLRRAEEAGVRARELGVDEADLDGFVRLARATAGSKHDNADYYLPGVFQGFLGALGSCASVIELRVDERLVAAMASLVDNTRYHLWCLGVDDGACDGFSPTYVLLAQSLRFAFAEGRPTVSAGRRNGWFKARYGFHSTELQVFLS